MNISTHISFEEATKSPTALRLGIKNEPDERQLAAMRLVAERCFEPLRQWYMHPIKVNSFFRCEALNRAVGGALASQHVKGEAIDMDAGSKTENKRIFEWCKENLIFDQLINEYDFSWVHISYKADGNRKQIVIVT